MAALLHRVAAPLLLGVLPLAVVVGMFATALDTGSLSADFHHEIYPEAKEILAGRNPFPDADADLSGGQNLIWPPLVAYLAAPLTWLEPGAANVVIAIFELLCFAAALRVAGVRDWRVYGACAMWAPVIGSIRTSHLTLLLCLLSALVWRYRGSWPRAGGALGLAVSLKFFVWPLVPWLVARGSRRAAGLSVALAAASLALLIPFTSVDGYLRTLLELSRTFDQSAYTPFGLLVQMGVPELAARITSLYLGAAVLVAMWRRRSFALAVAAALVLSPIVWLDYYALAAVPLAVVRPTFSLIWLLPLVTWGLPSAGYGLGDALGTARVLAVFAVVLLYAAWRETRHEAARPIAGSPASAPAR